MSQPQSSPASAPADEIVEKSVRGAATTTLAGLLGRAAGLLTTLIATHYVHKTDYGQANLALILATVVSALTLLAPQQALLTRRDRFAEAARLVQGYLLGSGLVVFAVLAIVSRPLLGLLHEPAALRLLQLYCVAMVLERVALIPTVQLRYQLRFSDLLRVDLFGDAVYVTVTISAAVLGSGALCLPLGYLARQLARVLWLSLRLSLPLWPSLGDRLTGPAWAESRQLLGELWRMTWPIYLSSLVELATLYMDNVFVGRVYSIGAQGVYAVGYTVIMTPSETIAMYAASALVRALGLQDPALRRQNYLLGLRTVSLCLVPMAIGAVLLAKTFEAAVLPPRWHGVAQVMTWLSPGAVSLGFHRMAFAQLTALHRSRLAAVIYATQLGSFALLLGLVAVTDPGRLHPERVAQAVSVALALAAVCGTVLTMWLTALRPVELLGAVAPAVVATALMAGGLLLWQVGAGRLGLPVTRLRLVGEVLLGIGCYALALRLTFPVLFRDARRFIARRK